MKKYIKSGIGYFNSGDDREKGYAGYSVQCNLSGRYNENTKELEDTKIVITNPNSYPLKASDVWFRDYDSQDSLDLSGITLDIDYAKDLINDYSREIYSDIQDFLPQYISSMQVFNGDMISVDCFAMFEEEVYIEYSYTSYSGDTGADATEPSWQDNKYSNKVYSMENDIEYVETEIDVLTNLTTGESTI